MNKSGLRYQVGPAGFALRALQLSRALGGRCRMERGLVEKFFQRIRELQSRLSKRHDLGGAKKNPRLFELWSNPTQSITAHECSK